MPSEPDPSERLWTRPFIFGSTLTLAKEPNIWSGSQFTKSRLRTGLNRTSPSLSWRQCYISIICPAMFYSAHVWYRESGQKMLIQPLTVAQNEACKVLAGCFHTTPRDTLHILLSIPPIPFCLQDLVRLAIGRLAGLPPTHSLRLEDRVHAITSLPRFISVPPPLPPLQTPYRKV